MKDLHTKRNAKIARIQQGLRARFPDAVLIDVERCEGVRPEHAYRIVVRFPDGRHFRKTGHDEQRLVGFSLNEDRSRWSAGRLDVVR